MDRTPNHSNRQGPSLLEVALQYDRRGWSVIPIKPSTEKPACRHWKKYQTEPPDGATLRRWFRGRNDRGLAVIMGHVSGGLVCRDFDVMDAYRQWERSHPELAEKLPTVATARGRHVYFLADHRGIIDLGDGELRGAGYCVLPPSRHPNGPEYRWLVPLPEGPVPRVDDLAAAGFLDRTPHETESTERTKSTEESRGEQKSTEAIVGVGRFASLHDLDQDVLETIRESLPAGPGRRNRQVFELARALKSIPRLADAAADDLEPYVRGWHQWGVEAGVIGTEPFEETWIDFLQAWPKVRFPKGAEPMVAILQRAKHAALPRAAERYDHDGLRLLIVLCRELQRASGDAPFFLASRTAGRLLEVGHLTAWRWLYLLQHDGVIEEVEKGDRAKRRASRYRYRGD